MLSITQGGEEVEEEEEDGVVLSTESIFSPRTKDMERDFYRPTPAKPGQLSASHSILTPHRP